MLYITTAVVLAWLAMAVADDTPCGRRLRRALVDGPARQLARITRTHVLLWTVVFGGTGLIAALLGHEAARVVAMGLPEFAGWITMFEVTAYLDALVALVTTASVAGLSGAKAWARALLPPRRPRARTPRRQRSASAAKKPANDDDPAWALAAA